MVVGATSMLSRLLPDLVFEKCAIERLLRAIDPSPGLAAGVRNNAFSSKGVR